MKNEQMLPGAVLLGSIIIGAGLYFGLRARPSGAPPGVDTRPAAPGVTVPVSTGAPAAADQGPQGPASPVPMAPGMGFAPPAVSPAVAAKAEADAKQALAREKTDVFLPKCWTPAIQANPQPAKMSVVFSVAFGPDGKEIGRGIQESREATREDVASCLRRQPLNLKISPPGVHVSLMLPMDLP